MDLDLLNWFRSFDFFKYFDVTMHKMKFENTKWKRDAIMKDLSEGFRTIKCSICEKNSLWINLTEGECFCGDDINFDNCTDDQVVKVGIIVSEFRIKLSNMERYFIYIQERYHYFTNPNSDFKLTPKNKRILNDMIESIDTKIEAFHSCIKKLHKSRGLELYTEAKEAYDKIKATVSEVLKTFSDLSQERQISKLLKRVDEDLGIIIKMDERFEEESKGEPKEEIKEVQKEKKDFLKQPDIFDKEIRIMVADYLSGKKINELHANFEKVCDCIDELLSQLNGFKEVNICRSLVWHAFVSNLCPINFKLKFYVIAKKFAYDFTNKYASYW